MDKGRQGRNCCFRSMTVPTVSSPEEEKKITLNLLELTDHHIENFPTNVLASP